MSFQQLESHSEAAGALPSSLDFGHFSALRFRYVDVATSLLSNQCSVGIPTFEISQVYVIEIFPFLDIIQVQEFQEK
jgi:hypothetical protein